MKGRKETNFSDWDRPQKEAHESAKALQKGTMPPWYYPWARLSPAERRALITGLQATIEQKGQEQADGGSSRMKTRRPGRTMPHCR